MVVAFVSVITMATITENEVYIKLSSHVDEEFERSFTPINVAIQVNGKEAGNLDAVLINRAEIRYGHFLSLMDEYSGDTRWISEEIFDPEGGLTLLESLEDHDNPMQPILYIKTLRVKPEYRLEGDSNVGAFALRKLLRHPFIVARDASMTVYVLSAREAMSEEEEEQERRERNKPYNENPRKKAKLEKRKRTDWLQRLARNDANQFLRNGFFQDESYASKGGAPAKILVASKHHWMNSKFLSHLAAEEIQFCKPPEIEERNDADEELFEYVKNQCNGCDKKDPEKHIIESLIAKGASLSRSGALHLAVGYNNLRMITFLVESYPLAINTFDPHGNTPLMIAAVRAAGRHTIDGIEDTRILDFLVREGAYTDLCNKENMTAYGCYLKIRNEDDVLSRRHPSEERVQLILCG